jgi:hypothetical protein
MDTKKIDDLIKLIQDKLSNNGPQIKVLTGMVDISDISKQNHDLQDYITGHFTTIRSCMTLLDMVAKHMSEISPEYRNLSGLFDTCVRQRSLIKESD